MSTPKRATIYFEPEIYKALRLRSLAAHRSMSELVNEAMRITLTQAGSVFSPIDPKPIVSSAAFDRLAKALKRRRLVRRLPRS